MRPGALTAFCFVQANGAGEKTEKTRRISLLRSGQKRFIGFVMTGRHPCSPREVTLSALPAAAYRAGRDFFRSFRERDESPECSRSVRARESC